MLKLRQGCRKPVRRHEEPVGVQGALRSVSAPHLLRSVPAFETVQGGAWLNPYTASRSRKALVPHGWSFGEQSSIQCDLSRAGDRTLQVSWHETLEKPDNATDYHQEISLVQGFRGLTARITAPDGPWMDPPTHKSCTRPCTTETAIDQCNLSTPPPQGQDPSQPAPEPHHD